MKDALRKVQWICWTESIYAGFRPFGWKDSCRNRLLYQGATWTFREVILELDNFFQILPSSVGSVVWDIRLLLSYEIRTFLPSEIVQFTSISCNTLAATLVRLLLLCHRSQSRNTLEWILVFFSTSFLLVPGLCRPHSHSSRHIVKNLKVSRAPLLANGASMCRCVLNNSSCL